MKSSSAGEKAHLAAPPIDHKDIQSEFVGGVERMRFTYVQVQVSLQEQNLFSWQPERPEGLFKAAAMWDTATGSLQPEV